jgi:hypothetical protein
LRPMATLPSLPRSDNMSLVTDSSKLSILKKKRQFLLLVETLACRLHVRCFSS